MQKIIRPSVFLLALFLAGCGPARLADNTKFPPKAFWSRVRARPYHKTDSLRYRAPDTVFGARRTYPIFPYKP